MRSRIFELRVETFYFVIPKLADGCGAHILRRSEHIIGTHLIHLPSNMPLDIKVTGVHPSDRGCDEAPDAELSPCEGSNEGIGRAGRRRGYGRRCSTPSPKCEVEVDCFTLES